MTSTSSSSKGGGGGRTAPNSSSSSQPPAGSECCMCGDYGLSSELFNCKLCQFRSQHRYCSNLYPKAESYRVCNWCLTQQKDETTNDQKTQNSSNSSSSSRKDSEHNNDPIKIKKKSINNSDNQGGLKGHQRGNLQLQLNTPIKKQRSPERSPASAGRKRVVIRGGGGGGGGEERLRRTRSEEISNGNVTKQVIRNKVRRYKLLDEVST